MESIVSIIVTVLCSVIASSGFWAWLQKKDDKKSLQSQMLIGLAHDRIVSLGMIYIERGWITKDEYENLRDYLYEPYKALGGNGSAKRVMEGVNRLKIFTVPPTKEGESQNEVNK
jgi:hypothetical protein